MNKIIQTASEGAAQVENLRDDMQIEDFICQCEMDYIERLIQMDISFLLRRQNPSKGRYKWKIFLYWLEYR